jgi:hypothetical protein
VIALDMDVIWMAAGQPQISHNHKTCSWLLMSIDFHLLVYSESYAFIVSYSGTNVLQSFSAVALVIV